MKDKITSRERIQKAINFIEPDRVPIDIGGTIETSIHIDEYIELGNYLGIDVELPKLIEQFQMLPRVEGKMLDFFHSDTIQVENYVTDWGYKNKDWKIWKTNLGNRVLVPGEFNTVEENDIIYLLDLKGEKVAYSKKDSLYFERNCSTQMSKDIVKMDPEKWKKSIRLYTDEELKVLEDNAKFLYNNTELSLVGSFAKGGLGTNGIWAGHTITDWLCILLTDTDYAYSIVQAAAERAVENLKLYIEAVGEYVDIIYISGTDYGTQKAELFNPEIFREIHMPNYKLINDYIHQNTNAKTMLHSCGSIRRIIPYLIEAGVDILNPVQISAENMDPSSLKSEFGNDIVFWGGGADTQHILPYGTQSEVEQHVKEMIEIFAKGGGFVFNPVHNLQYGIPPENIETMIDAVLKYGIY